MPPPKLHGQMPELSAMEQMQLAMLPGQPGWAVFTRLAAQVIESARDEILQIEPDQHKKILAAQVEARAMAKFYVRLTKLVETHINQHREQIYALQQQRDTLTPDE